MKITKHLTLIVFLLLSFTFTSCARDLVTGKKVLNVYSIDSDVQLGSYVMKMQLAALKRGKKDYDTKKNKKQLELIKEITDNIAKVSHYQRFPYEVRLVDVDIANAWCAPGGKIMVYEGLWDKKKGLVEKGNKDELAAVLAHEIAHANARHVTEAISRNVTIMAVGQATAAVIRTGSVTGSNAFGSIFSQGMNIFVPAYSRQNEFEADRIGLFYMSKAGYDPRAAVKLWRRAAKMKGNNTSIFASHPPSGIRAKELEKYLPEAIVYFEEVTKSRKGRKR